MRVPYGCERRISRPRAALVLEPSSMYGLYHYPRFRKLVPDNGTIPVLRIAFPGAPPLPAAVDRPPAFIR